MEFDKSRVYTELNADEVKIGSKGYFSDNLWDLMKKVERNNKDYLRTVSFIKDKTITNRFLITDNISSYHFFYLVEEEEEKWRPYKDTDEMIYDFLKRYNSYNGNCNKNNPMYNPLIWIKRTDSQYAELIVAISKKNVCANAVYTLKMLFDDFTYLNGSPCGIKEEKK